MKERTSAILEGGSAGKFAERVLPALAKRGAKVRGLIRCDSDAPAVRAHGATEEVIGYK